MFGLVPSLRATAFAVALLSAVCGAETLETAVWQAKIDAASAAGGGTVVVTPGDHVVANLQLKNDVTLEIPDGARLLGSTNHLDYAKKGPRSVVLASQATNVSLVGKGTIDGRGWAAEHREAGRNRWRDVVFDRCRDVRIEDVTLRDAGSWCCHFRECDGVVARRVTVRTLVNFNNDGLDIEAANVLIEDCDIVAEDDAICFKNDNPDFAVTNCLVRNCRVSSNCNFIKFGTTSYGLYRDIVISNCQCECVATMPDLDWRGKVRGVTARETGISGVALEVVDGGRMERVRVSDITLGEGVQTPVFVRLGARHPVPAGRESYLRDIVLERIRCRAPAASSVACSITGVPGLRPERIVLRDCDFVFPGGGTKKDAAHKVSEAVACYPENRMFGRGVALPAYGFFLRHADDVRFENVKVRTVGEDARRPFVAWDCRRVGVTRGAPYGETAVWQAKIDAASAAGGGTVVVGPGDHPVASLFLKDNVTLRLEQGARLVASTNKADYVSGMGLMDGYHAGTVAVVGAIDAKNVAIEGAGEIDGRGWAIAETEYNNETGRWRDVFFYRCHGVRVEGVTLRNAATWTCHFRECVDVVARRVTVRSVKNHNNDGIDIDARNVLVEDCDIDSEDDAICLKSDNVNFVCENVEVRRCRVGSNCNHIKLGTSSCGGFRNVFIHDIDCVPCSTNVVPQKKNRNSKGNDIPGWNKAWIGSRCGIAVECVDGGILENVRISDVRLNRCCQTPIFVRLGRRAKPPKGRSSHLKDVVIENVTGESMSLLASSVTGVPGLRPQNVTIRNVKLKLMGGGPASEVTRPVPESEAKYPENRMFNRQMLPAYGFYVRHADGVRFENVTLDYTGDTEERPALVSDDSTGITCDACDFKKPVGTYGISLIRQ